MASWKYCSQFDLWICSGNMLKVALLDASIGMSACGGFVLLLVMNLSAYWGKDLELGTFF